MLLIFLSLFFYSSGERTGPKGTGFIGAYASELEGFFERAAYEVR
jgi:hypothetical protein